MEEVGRYWGVCFTSTCPSVVVQSEARVATAGTTAWSVGTPVLTVSIPRVTLIYICAVKLAKKIIPGTLSYIQFIDCAHPLIIHTHTHTLRNNCRGLPMQLTLLEERV